MGRRATTLKELGALQAKMFTPASSPAGESVGRAFEPRPSDVIISPYGKSGTTWLQQIFHTLRTGGDEDFDDISRVVPWIETAPLLGIDLDAEQKADPRGFKSHLSWERVPKGCRYIVSLRDPLDVLVSSFRFMEGWFLEPGTVTIEEFARALFIPRPRSGGPSRADYWQHLESWWSARHEESVLLLSYEGMHRDPAGTIRQVARHAGIPLDDALLGLTLERSSLEHMLRHKDKFDDRLMRELSQRRGDLPADLDSAKVRLGRVGSHRDELGDELIAAVNAVWTERIEGSLGYTDYAALEAALAVGD